MPRGSRHRCEVHSTVLPARNAGSLCTAWRRVRILWPFAVRDWKRLGARAPWKGKRKAACFFFDDRPEHARGTSGPARVNRTAR